MTIAELIRKLQSMDPDLIVYRHDTEDGVAKVETVETLPDYWELPDGVVIA